MTRRPPSARARALAAAAVLATVITAGVLGAAGPAAAAGGTAPRLVISPESLTFSEADDRRSLTLSNAGDDVLRLGNVSIVMFGQRASVQFDVDAPGARELEPGASATINLTLRSRVGEPGQVFAALLVPAEDPRLPLDVDLRTGAPIARRIAGVALRVGQSHVLTWMIVVPLVGFLLLWLTPVGRSRRASLVALAAAGVTLVLAAVVALRFDPAFTVEDGNQGRQLVAQVVASRALGLEFAVGVDGTSLLFVLLAPLVGLAAVASAGALAPERRGRALAALLLAQAGATGVFVAVDGALFACSWLLAAIGLVALAGPRAPRADGKAAVSPFAVAAGTSTLLLFVALATVRAHAAPTYLHDGTPVAHTFDLANLAGGGLAARLGGPLLGVPAPVALGAALFAAFALAMPLFPFHGWAAGTFERASAPASLALAGLFSTMGAYGLVRIGVGVLPQAVSSASTVLLVLGALGALHAALLAVSTRDLGRLLAHAGALQMSFCLLGAAALTPAGVTGALATAFAHGLGAVLAFSLLGAFGERPLTLASLDGLGGTAPGAARWLACALAATAAAPGLATFVGPTLVALDVATQRPWIALPVLAAFAVVAGALARAGAGILSRVRAPGTAAIGARSPDARTLALAAPVAAMLLVLGIVPAAMFDAVGASVVTLLRLIAAARS